MAQLRPRSTSGSVAFQAMSVVSGYVSLMHSSRDVAQRYARNALAMEALSLYCYSVYQNP